MWRRGGEHLIYQWQYSQQYDQQYDHGWALVALLNLTNDDWERLLCRLNEQDYTGDDYFYLAAYWTGVNLMALVITESISSELEKFSIWVAKAPDEEWQQLLTEYALLG